MKLLNCAFAIGLLSCAAACGGTAVGSPEGGGDAGNTLDGGAPGGGSSLDGGTPDSDAGSASDAGSPGGGSDAGTADGGLVAARPYGMDIPSGYDASQPTPLILLLHAYSIDGEIQDEYFGFAALADTSTVLIARPDGTIDSTGNRFWNATDACCDFGHTGVDDVAYLNAVLDDVEQKYNVDRNRVFVVGHSNGAFMAHRLACDSAGRIAAFVALAGDNWLDPTRCNPSQPVAALQVHGDADQTIAYDGGVATAGAPPFPSAPDSIATWAAKNGCTGGLVANGQTLNLDSSLAGNETVEATWTCTQGDAELWTIHGGAHAPALITPEWGNVVFAWLMAHARN